MAVPPLRSILGTLSCNAQFALRRVTFRRVLAEGWPPILYTKGIVHFGDRLILRSRVARSELGAVWGARLVIGNNVFINQGASIVSYREIRIGSNVLIGDFVSIYDTDHHQLEEGKATSTEMVEIGNNVWIGRGSIILPGVRIGDHAVVAAGSVVTQSIAPKTVVAGNPAKPIKEISASAGWIREPIRTKKNRA